MRKTCLCCVLKHLGKASILLSESKLGYPEHFWLGLSNLSEAEDECVADYPFLAQKIRKLRIQIETGKKKGTELMKLLKEVIEFKKSIEE